MVIWKRMWLSFLGVGIINGLSAQHNVGIGTLAPDSSAALEIAAENRGVLIPRMSTIQRLAIENPALGLLVFDITTQTFWFQDGNEEPGFGGWTELLSSKRIYADSTVQEKLDAGATPLELYQQGYPLDSLYGRTYAGGFIFYLNRFDGSGLVAAPEDYSGGWVTWHNGSSIKTFAEGTEIGSGTNNTALILYVQGEGAYAASVCVDANYNGYEDWFLPSRDELNEMLLNLKPRGYSVFSGFGYWSSSEAGVTEAWFQDPTNGHQEGMGKGQVWPVRAVRWF